MIKHLWQSHKVALIAFVIALAAMVYFGVKTITSTIYWMDPAHQDQKLSGWMSPRYVARSYKLPPDTLGPALFLVKGQAPRRISLETIAEENGLTLNDLQARIDAAAADWRASQANK